MREELLLEVVEEAVASEPEGGFDKFDPSITTDVRAVKLCTVEWLAPWLGFEEEQ